MKRPQVTLKVLEDDAATRLLYPWSPDYPLPRLGETMIFNDLTGQPTARYTVIDVAHSAGMANIVITCRPERRGQTQ